MGKSYKVPLQHMLCEGEVYKKGKFTIESEDCLFTLAEMAAISVGNDCHKYDIGNYHTCRKERCNNLKLCMSLSASGPFQMPELKSFTGTVPTRLVPFSSAIGKADFTAGVHFYIDDYMFERIWTSPEKYVEKLSKFPCVIGPDFSQYSDMSYPMRMWNCYRNRVLSSYFQRNGVNLVPNVTWSLPDSYEYSFCGIPKDSPIAINCTSIIHCNLSKFLWYKGYNEAIRRLNPSLIIRYGTVMEDERKDISIYFENERLKLLRYGR